MSLKNRMAGVPRRKKRALTCGFKKSAYLCSAFHLNQATESPIYMPAAFFMPLAYRISSVPCGALMRPLPDSRWKATGSGTFFIPAPKENFNTFRFI